MGKDQEWSGLMKIPNEVVIKELRIALGKSISEVQKKDHEIKNLKNQITQLKSKHIPKKQLDDLNQRAKIQKEKNDELKNKYADLMQEYLRLQKQLLKTIHP